MAIMMSPPFFPLGKQKRWHRLVLLISFLLSSLKEVAAGLCPQLCICDDTDLSVKCVEADLANVPIFLNPRLLDLNISKNKIRKLEGALEIYTEVETVDVSYNKLKHLGKRQFAAQNALQTLFLSNNFVASLHQNAFEGLTNLQTLDLSRNIITTMDNGTFLDLENLVELRLSHNKIGRLSERVFDGLSRLRVLHLDHNLLTHLRPEWLRPLENLRFLYLGDNLLGGLAAFTFRPLRALQVIDLSHNRLHNISEAAFFGARSIDTLELSGNLLSSVPSEAITDLGMLNSLDISGNPIEVITSASFQGLSNLQSIKMNEMYMLKRVEGNAFSSNTKLASVSLDNNRGLEPLPWGIFSHNLVLTSLTMRNNTLWTSLSPMQIPDLRSLRLLGISGLPLYCNCSLHWLWDIYRQNNSKIQIDEVVCESVSNSPRSDIALRHLEAEELKCADWTYVLVVASISLLVTIFILVLAAIVVYKCRKWALNRKYTTPCLHIKDDTMVYKSSLHEAGAGQPASGILTGTYAKASNGGYSPTSTTEPFYEVPRFTNATNLSTSDPEDSNKSSSAASSGYIGSELWESGDFYGGSPAHLLPNHNHHQGGQAMQSQTPYYTTTLLKAGYSPRSSSSGLGGSASGSSTASSVCYSSGISGLQNLPSGSGPQPPPSGKPIFFSPGRNYHTNSMFTHSASNSPAKFAAHQPSGSGQMIQMSSPKYFHTSARGSPKPPGSGKNINVNNVYV